MKKVKLVLIFSLLLGSGIVATVALAQQVFNPFMSGQGYQQGVYSGFTPDVDSPNAILGVISNPSPQADPVFFSLPDNIEGWMTLLSDPANYGLIPEFIKWLENNPANIDAFAKYILEHYHELGGLFNALQTQIGTYGFAGSKYNLYFGRESNNFLNLAITDKDNALVLGAVFDKEGKKVSSIEVEGNTATVESSGKTYNLKLINPIKYVPGDGLSSALSFNKDGEISIKLNENSSLVITAQGNLVLKINGKEITLNSTGREVQLTYKAQGEIVISDGDNPARIVVDKNGEVTVWKGRNERTAISGNKIDIEFKPSGEIRLTNEKGEGFIITPQGVVYQTVKLTDAQQLIKYLSSENTIILPENTIILPDGRKIVLPPESQIIQNADGSWTVTLSDGTQIVIDKEGKLMTINRPGVSFQLDISGLSQVNVGLEGDKLTIKGYQTTQVCLEGESPCPANVFSLTISSSGELSVDNGSAKIKVHGVEITLKPGMSLKFDEDAVIVTLKQGISYSINKGGQITGITINGINIPLPPGVKPSDIEINPDGSVKVTINGKTYTFKIVEQPGNAVGTSYETLQIVLPNGQTLQLPPGAKLGNNEKGELVVFNKAGKEIATIRFNADGSFSINGIQFVITEVDGFQVFLGIDDNGKIWIKAGKNGVEKSIEITPDMKSVEIFKRNGDLVIRYSYSNGISEEVVIQGSPTATPAPGGTPAPGVNKPRDNNEALEWLKSGDSEKIKIALEYLMKNFNSLTDEQKNSLAELLGNLLGLLFEIDGWENFLKTLFEDGKIKDVHKLLIAQRILGLVHQLLVSEAGKNLLKSILDFLIAKTPGPADAFDYYQNLLEQYLLVISQQEGGRDFLEDYIGKLALSALGKSKWSSEYKKLDKVIKTMLRLGFGHFLEEIAYRLSNPNNPNEKKNAGKLIREIMQASVLPGPTASYDDWLKWLKENPARIEEFLDWLKDHPDYIDDFLTWIRRKENIELWDAFLNLLTGKNALAKKVVEILAKSDAGIKFLADLLEGQNSPLRNDKEKRENLAWALEGLIADLVNKAKGTNSEISRAAVALLLAMARYGNDNALEALKSLAEKGNIFAIQAIQYLITDNNRTDLLDFLVKLASDPKLRDKVLEALGLLVNDKSIEQKIRAGAIRTLIEIAKRGLDEATRIAAVNKLWQLGIWLLDPKNENRGDKWEELVDKIIDGLKEIANQADQYHNVKSLAQDALKDLEYRKNNSDSSSPTPTPKPSTNNTTNNPPSGTGPAFNLSGSTDSRNGRSSESRSDDNNKPSQRNSPDSLSQYLRHNIFNHPSLRSPLQRLNKSKKASSKLKERFKNVNKKLGQKSKILAKGLREKLKKQGLSEEEIEAKVKEFLQKLAEGDEEAKKYLEELGLAKEEIEKDFQDAEGFFSAEDQERYLKENFGIEAEEAKEIMNMTDEQAQIDFLKNEGFSESTAKLIVNPKLVEKELDAFFKLVEELEDKLGLEDNPEAREEIADLLMEALLSEEITLENAGELVEDPKTPGEKITRLELVLRDILKKIGTKQSAFSPFLR